MEKIKVSVITIAYNAEKTICKTIESILSQDYENIEYILVDGNSTDNTVGIVKRFKDSRIHLISEPDNGISDAFNKGIKKASGYLIGLVNADDTLLPHALANLIFAYKNGIDVVYGNTIVNDEKNSLLLNKRAGNIEQIKYELPFIHQSSLVRKEAYEKFGLYSEKYKLCMDYELFARMSQGGAKFQYVDTNVCCFSYGGASCEYPFKTIDENLSIAKKYGLKSKEALKYKIKLYIRNIIKIILVRLRLWGILYKTMKPSSIYHGEV